MVYVNCKSDFEFELRFVSQTTGEVLPQPQFRWEALLHTIGHRRDGYKVASHSEGCFNCTPTDTGYMVRVDRHTLHPGMLLIELKVFLRDDSYPDHVKELTLTHVSGLHLVCRDCNNATTPIVDFHLPSEAVSYTPPQTDVEGTPLTKEDIDSIIF